MSRGTVVLSFAVFCASLSTDCYTWTGDQCSTRKDAKKEAVRLGWRFTRAHGWLCPTCQEKA